MHHFLLVICSNNRFRDGPTTIHAVYVTVCDLQKSVRFDTTVETNPNRNFIKLFAVRKPNYSP